MPVTESGSIRLGKYDLNSEFDVLEASTLFLNNAHGIGTDLGQTGKNGPSIFPVTGLAARFAWQWNRHWSIRLSALDGAPGEPDDPGETDIGLDGDEGALLISELKLSLRRSRVLLGIWRYSEAFEEWAGAPQSNFRARSNDNDGFYVRGETPLGGSDSEVMAFVRYGQAAAEYNMFSTFIGAGLNWHGPLAERPNDRLGLAIAWAETSSVLEAARPQIEDREIALELTYRLNIADRLVLQPDLQYIVNPGLQPEVDDALAICVRMELKFL